MQIGDKPVRRPADGQLMRSLNELTANNLTIYSILVNREEVWSFFNNEQEANTEKLEKVQNFRKTSSKKNTLIFDLVDLFIDIYDPN